MGTKEEYCLTINCRIVVANLSRFGIVFVITHVISGYVAGRSRKISSIVMVSLITTVLAGVIGLATIGSVTPERLFKATGIGWTSNTLILTWVSLNGSLTLIAGYVKFRFNRHS